MFFLEDLQLVSFNFANDYDFPEVPSWMTIVFNPLSIQFPLNDLSVLVTVTALVTVAVIVLIINVLVVAYWTKRGR
jgi:hypothetical protein